MCFKKVDNNKKIKNKIKIKFSTTKSCEWTKSGKK